KSTSVARKIHIPSFAASGCWSISSNCSATSADSSDSGEVKIGIFLGGIRVRSSGDDWRLFKIMFQRWRRRLPFQAGCAPRIWPGDATEFQRPQKINQRKQISDTKNRCAGGGEDVEQLKLRRIGVVAPRHSKITQNELRKESEIESDESDHGGEFAGELRIQAPGYFRPPIMQAAHEGHHHSADHD